MGELSDLLWREVVTKDLDLGYVRYPRLVIQGIEVTQAIQYYRSDQHLTDPADRAADNAVRLISGKTAWVRVYVRAGIFTGDVPNVTGTLEISRRVLGFYYTPVTTLNPQPPGTVTARRTPAYSVERGTLGYTLNFVIPAAQMCGHLRLRAVVNSPSGYSDDHTTYIDVTLEQTLRLRGIFVGYNGPASSAAGAPNLTIAAPGLADLQTTAAWALLTFPVRGAATFGSAGTITWNLPLTDAPSCSGCCTPNWVALNSAVQAQRVADGNRTDVLYYGLMGVGIPMGPIVGCNSGGVSTGSNGQGVTMAHELGHACGLPHAPCGTPGDPNYPAYEPYDPAGSPNASIGEYGLDISNGTIMPPATFKDMMAYCGPRWISLYNYGRLTNNANLHPVLQCVDHWWWRDVILYDELLIPEKWLPDPPPDPVWRNRIMDRVSLISIIGLMHSENEIEIKSVMRLDAMPEVVNGEKTGLTAELLGAKGRVVAGAGVFRLRTHSMGECGCEEDHGDEPYPFLFQTFIPNLEEGDGLRIRDGEKVVWHRPAPVERSVLGGFRARMREDKVAIDWQYKSMGEDKPEFWLQWSDDEGKTWNALATGLQDGKAEVSIAGLPAGDVTVRLLASDGFSTSVSEHVHIEIPGFDPVISILHPRDGQTFAAGQAMRLLGMVSSTSGDAVEVSEFHWQIDQREVKAELDDFITAPPAGEHQLTLLVATRGNKAEVSVRFRTIALPDEDEPMRQTPKMAQ